MMFLALGNSSLEKILPDLVDEPGLLPWRISTQSQWVSCPRDPLVWLHGEPGDFTRGHGSLVIFGLANFMVMCVQPLQDHSISMLENLK
jgi:hypothetical protein